MISMELQRVQAALHSLRMQVGQNEQNRGQEAIVAAIEALSAWADKADRQLSGR